MGAEHLRLEPELRLPLGVGKLRCRRGQRGRRGRRGGLRRLLGEIRVIVRLIKILSGGGSGEGKGGGARGEQREKAHLFGNPVQKCVAGITRLPARINRLVVQTPEPTRLPCRPRLL